MRDELVVGGIVGLFAVWVTLHFVLAVKLTRIRPFWHGPLGLVFPPPVPYWAWRAGFRKLAVAWGVTLGVWLVLRFGFSG